MIIIMQGNHFQWNNPSGKTASILISIDIILSSIQTANTAVYTSTVFWRTWTIQTWWILSCDMLFRIILHHHNGWRIAKTCTQMSTMISFVMLTEPDLIFLSSSHDVNRTWWKTLQLFQALLIFKVYQYAKM